MQSSFPQLRILAQDGGSPAKSDTTVVTISVIRNLFGPQFADDSVFATVTENQVIGDTFQQVTCTDADTSAPNNEVEYTLSGSDKILQYFQISRSTGAVSVIQPLHLDADNTATYRVSWNIL